MNQEQVEKLQSFARTFERHFELGFNFEIEKEDVDLLNTAAKTLKRQKEELKQLKRENEGLLIDRECAISNITNNFLDEDQRLRKALKEIMEVEAPNMEGWETEVHKIAREALGISQNECFGDGEVHD